MNRSDKAAGPSGAKDRKSTRLNSSHLVISYAVFCLKKKKNKVPTCPKCMHTSKLTFLKNSTKAMLTDCTLLQMDLRFTSYLPTGSFATCFWHGRFPLV